MTQQTLHRWAPRVAYALLLALLTVGGWWVNRVEAQIDILATRGERLAALEEGSRHMNATIDRLVDVARRLELAVARLEDAQAHK